MEMCHCFLFWLLELPGKRESQIDRVANKFVLVSGKTHFQSLKNIGGRKVFVALLVMSAKVRKKLMKKRFLFNSNSNQTIGLYSLARFAPEILLFQAIACSTFLGGVA